jgi:hypothetical protein
MIWFTALDRGNHGMADSFKYRKMITEFIFEGKSPSEGRDENKVASARSAIGAPAPETALEQARRLRARLGARAGQQNDSEATSDVSLDVAVDEVQVSRRSPYEQARDLHQRLKNKSD